MSFGGEYIAEYEYERDQAIAKWEEMSLQAFTNASHGLWITKDGRYLHVTEMETTHIQNCIRMLRRYDSPFKDAYISMFEKELKERGETE